MQLIDDRPQAKRNDIPSHAFFFPPCGDEKVTAGRKMLACPQKIVFDDFDWAEQHILSITVHEVLERRDSELIKMHIQ